MATSLLEFVVDRLRLVFADIVEDVQVLLFLLVQAGVELVGDHFVDTSLTWKQFTLPIEVD